ncbi:sulfate ABC transporter substrate-binding protein [Coraliomargarita parva]|uniref:sulfate ABC transporter substrate-binding protein n=1 Tax=Coraliomargarita parva TaxID=3014050 RepID=UPI0022B43B0A|nr:sulfate ABC transporter substrate-binding protein [Coraliomargarita parva]
MSLYEKADQATEHGGRYDLLRRRMALIVSVATLLLLGAVWFHFFVASGPVLRVLSFDASREFQHELDLAYQAMDWEGQSPPRVMTLHAGSVRQARSLTEGVVADLICLGSPFEMMELVRGGYDVPPDWQERYPDGASPFSSTIVFLVRRGNPKGITGWEDLRRLEVRTVMPSPRVSAAGRYAYLALVESFRRMPVEPGSQESFDAVAARIRYIESGARHSLSAFLANFMDDVLLTWESEAQGYLAGMDVDSGVEVVYPGFSIRAEPVVSVLPMHAREHEAELWSQRYLELLFSEGGQLLASRYGFRVNGETGVLPDIERFRVESAFGSWDEAWRQHLGPEGSFERIQALKKARTGGSE